MGQEITDEKIKMEVQMEKDFYQSTLREAVDAIVMHYKLDRDRVIKIAEGVYEEDMGSQAPADDDD